MFTMVKRKEGEEKKERTGRGEKGETKTKDGRRGGALCTHPPPFQIVLCIVSSFRRDLIIVCLSNFKCCFMFSFRLSFCYLQFNATESYCLLRVPILMHGELFPWYVLIMSSSCSRSCFFLKEPIVPLGKESWQICPLLTSAKSLGMSLHLDIFLC